LVPVTANIPGPGYYNAEKVDIFPIYKYKPSSVFVSRVGRDNQKSLKTHSAFPTKNQLSTSHNGKAAINPLNDDDYYEEDDDDDGKTPGPGAYWNP
jgi:hypothetical protein